MSLWMWRGLRGGKKTSLPKHLQPASIATMRRSTLEMTIKAFMPAPRQPQVLAEEQVVIMTAMMR